MYFIIHKSYISDKHISFLGCGGRFIANNLTISLGVVFSRQQSLAVYNLTMKTFHYSVPIDVRYGDLDPQWHVNNARYLTFLEHARLSYLLHLGLFDGKNFLDFNLIVADIHIAYLAPIQLGQKVAVHIRCERIGNKSLTFVYEIRDEDTRQVLSSAETIMVTFDYHQQQSIPVPDAWRQAISALEGVAFLK
mgnify:FL=1